MEELFTQVYESVSEMLDDKKIEVSELTAIIGPTMELIEKIASDKSGSEKKALLLAVFKKVVNEVDMPEEVRSPLLLACDTVIPPLVDIIIAASKGDLEINLSAEGCRSCFAFFKK